MNTSPPKTSMPVKAAAQMAFDSTVETIFAKNARRWEVERRFAALSLYATEIVEKSNAFRLYGKPRGSNAYVSVPKSPDFYLSDDMTGLIGNRKQGRNNIIEYSDPHVMRADLQQYIDKLKTEDRVERRKDRRWRRMYDLRQYYQKNHGMTPEQVTDLFNRHPLSQRLLAYIFARTKGVRKWRTKKT